MSLCQPVIWSMAAILRDSTVAAVVRTRPRAIPLAIIAIISHIWVAYGALLGGPSGRRSSAINRLFNDLVTWRFISQGTTL